MLLMVKTNKEIELMRKGGRILGTILETLAGSITPGTTTEQLNAEAEKLIADAGCKPAFKGYSMMNLSPYPGALCTSINEEVVHGLPIPSRTLSEGDIIGIDLGLIYTEGDTRVYLDAARTVGVGHIEPQLEKLIRITKEALDAGIAQVAPGARIGDIGHAVESYVAPHNYGVIRELVGHGVGRKIHESPEIPNYGKAGTGIALEAGMTIAIEPMITLGDWPLIFHPNSWRITTEDGAKNAHFEHTVLVTKEGHEILTLPA